MSDPFMFFDDVFGPMMGNGSPFIRQPFRPRSMISRGTNPNSFDNLTNNVSLHQFLAQNRRLPRTYYSTPQRFGHDSRFDEEDSSDEEESFEQRQAAIREDYKQRQLLALQQQREEQEKRKKYMELEYKRQQILEQNRQAYRKELIRQEEAAKEREITRIKQQELEKRRIIQSQREAEREAERQSQLILQQETQNHQKFETIEGDHEKQIMKDRLALYNMKERSVLGDGNCQFSAVSDQLFQSPKFHALLRQKVCDWLRSNRDLVIGDGALLSDFLDADNFNSWDEYVDYMSRSGSWGDHITLVAITNMFQISVMIVSSIDEEKAGKGGGVVFIEPVSKKDSVKK